MFNFYVLHLLHANTSFNPKMCQTFWSVFQDGSAEVYRAYIKAPSYRVAAVKKLVVGSRDRVGEFVAVFCGSHGPSGVVAGRRPCRRGTRLMAGFHLARAARRRVWAGVLNWMPVF